MTKPPEKSKLVRKLRCAVYTRKSSEEGLEQEFNSLHAQREACEAYIASQRSEGWVLVRDRYDDGGISGGTLERPALKRLLADVEDGLVDVVVVYKIDRLSRSLMDFSKLVEVFDRNAELGASGVGWRVGAGSSSGRAAVSLSSSGLGSSGHVGLLRATTRRRERQSGRRAQLSRPQIHRIRVGFHVLLAVCGAGAHSAARACCSEVRADTVRHCRLR
jgi:hypothetical protein